MTYKNRKQRGFTLVELIVVVGIIAALAAVIIPNVSQFAGSGDQASYDTEISSVQAAMDLYMADTGTTAVTAQTATTDLAASSPDLTGYIRNTTTQCSYAWDTAGIVTQSLCP